jgi:hypothetical protein
MSANLPLNEMSLQEKLQAMEALWEDLSREPDLHRRGQVTRGAAEVYEDISSLCLKID